MDPATILQASRGSQCTNALRQGLTVLQLSGGHKGVSALRVRPIFNVSRDIPVSPHPDRNTEQAPRTSFDSSTGLTGAHMGPSLDNLA